MCPKAVSYALKVNWTFKIFYASQRNGSVFSSAKKQNKSKSDFMGRERTDGLKFPNLSVWWLEKEPCLNEGWETQVKWMNLGSKKSLAKWRKGWKLILKQAQIWRQPQFGINIWNEDLTVILVENYKDNCIIWTIGILSSKSGNTHKVEWRMSWQGWWQQEVLQTEHRH